MRLALVPFGLSRWRAYRTRNVPASSLKRGQNIRAALSKIIEKAGEVDVNASAVVAAVVAYSKLNAKGEWVDKIEQTITTQEVFDKMTTEELEAYASSGVMPARFMRAEAATSDS